MAKAQSRLFQEVTHGNRCIAAGHRGHRQPADLHARAGGADVRRRGRVLAAAEPRRQWRRAGRLWHGGPAATGADGGIQDRRRQASHPRRFPRPRRLLNIWATWCGPCRSEMPSLDRLQALHRDDGLAVLTVSVDSEGFGAVRRFYAQSGIRNLGLYLDVDGATAHAFGTQSIPTTLLIDRDGKVVGSLVGAMEWDSPDALALIRHYLDS